MARFINFGDLGLDEISNTSGYYITQILKENIDISEELLSDIFLEFNRSFEENDGYLNNRYKDYSKIEYIQSCLSLIEREGLKQYLAERGDYNEFFIYHLEDFYRQYSHEILDYLKQQGTYENDEWSDLLYNLATNEYSAIEEVLQGFFYHLSSELLNIQIDADKLHYLDTFYIVENNKVVEIDLDSPGKYFDEFVDFMQTEFGELKDEGELEDGIWFDGLWEQHAKEFFQSKGFEILDYDDLVERDLLEKDNQQPKKQKK